MTIPVGVTTKKNTIPIAIGATKEPRNIPNLNQITFSGDNNFELIIPKTRKIIDTIKDHNLISPPDFSGHKAIMRKIMKKTIPKLLLDEIFILFCVSIANLNLIKKYNIKFILKNKRYF